MGVGYGFVNGEISKENRSRKHTKIRWMLFSELVSEKKVNRLIMEISCPSLLNYDDYKDLFQQIYKMAEDPKGFETRLSFKYQNEDKNLHNF